MGSFKAECAEFLSEILEWLPGIKGDFRIRNIKNLEFLRDSAGRTPMKDSLGAHDKGYKVGAQARQNHNTGKLNDVHA